MRTRLLVLTLFLAQAACPDPGSAENTAPRDGGAAGVDVPRSALTDAPPLRDASMLDAAGDDAFRDAAAGEVSRDVPPLRDAPIDAVGTLDGPSAGVDPLDPARMPPIDTDPAHYPANVWVTDAMAKVQPGDRPGPAHWAVLASARNEFENLQVHVRADGAPLTVTSVALSDLVDARSGARLPASRAVVFRQDYLDVATPSDLNGLRGLVPDALVPTVDALVHEARNALPVTVPAATTRSFWIELFVPPGTPSGYFTGSITVRTASGPLATMPVRLKVWAFDLPATSSLPNFFAVSYDGLCVQATGSYRACGAFPGAGGDPDRGVERTHVLTARFLLDYRLTNAETPYAGTDTADWGAFDALYGPLLDGTADTRLRGARMTSLAYVGVPGDYALVQRWAVHARERGWLDRLLYYHCDEPPLGCSFAEAAAEERSVHARAPGVATLLTTGIDELQANAMEDAVDIVTPLLDVLSPRDAASRRSRYDAFLLRPGKRLWWYQDCTEHGSCVNGRPGSAANVSPSYMVDASPLRNRVFQWMAHLERVGGELYYGLDHCWGTACGAGSRDPWASLYAFGGHGDGTLMYPGLPARIGGATPIPLPSIRLQLVRDGFEDYEYLHALAAAGDGAFAEARARTFITGPHAFGTDPGGLVAARAALGDRLHARSLR